MMDPANGRAEFVCTARTEDRYPVVIASQFNIPFLLNKAGTGHVRSWLIFAFCFLR